MMRINATIPRSLAENRLIRLLFNIVAELELDRRDFAVFGSGPLLAHGLRQHVRDLDVVARGDVWRRVSRHGFPAIGAINGAPMVQFWDGLIQFSATWVSESWDTDELIDRAEIIQGLPFARLCDVLAYKQILRRPKDLADIEVLKDVLCLHSSPPGPVLLDYTVESFVARESMPVVAQSTFARPRIRLSGRGRRGGGADARRDVPEARDAAAIDDEEPSLTCCNTWSRGSAAAVRSRITRRPAPGVEDRVVPIGDPAGV